MIAVVDYGLGNVQAFLNAYKRLNVPARRATTVGDLAGATKVVLPGVGAFDHAMERLEASGMREALDRAVLAEGLPVLGVCVGMQILAHASEEGTREGLGWVDGRVRRLSGRQAADPLPLPHMGWNDVEPRLGQPLFDGLDVEARFYFLHSYYFECTRPDDVAAVTSYGEDFACAVRCRHIHGVQFHPEKSHHFGMRLLRNFADL
jgi:imidazole glycerol-phosphate synthase subunit HisH